MECWALEMKEAEKKKAAEKEIAENTPLMTREEFLEARKKSDTKLAEWAVGAVARYLRNIAAGHSKLHETESQFGRVVMSVPTCGKANVIAQAMFAPDLGTSITALVHDRLRDAGYAPDFARSPGRTIMTLSLP